MLRSPKRTAYVLVGVLVVAIAVWVAMKQPNDEPSTNGARIEERVVKQLRADAATALKAQCTILEPGDPPSWSCDVLTVRTADHALVRSDSYWVRQGGAGGRLRIEPSPIQPFTAG